MINIILYVMAGPPLDKMTMPPNILEKEKERKIPQL